jgi:hypothetical protein
MSDKHLGCYSHDKRSMQAVPQQLLGDRSKAGDGGHGGRGTRQQQQAGWAALIPTGSTTAE